MFNSLIQYFQSLEQHPFQRLAFLTGGLLLFWVLEGAIPLLPLQYKKTKLRHAAVNFSFTLIHLLIHSLLALMIIRLSDWCLQQKFGLVYWTHAGIGLTILLSIFVLDFFVGWLVHIVQHKIPILWRFHVIHHADNKVDVTTGLRHHPIESMVRGVFFFIGIAICGAPMYAVMIYQTILVFATAFTHANISLPKWLDVSIGYLLVSPNMHKVHHHWQQPFTDTNYGAVFSIWDRTLGTLKNLNPSQIRYGLDRYYPNEKDEDFVQLLQSPFKKMDPKN